jgi:hypothetical protein
VKGDTDLQNPIQLERINQYSPTFHITQKNYESVTAFQKSVGIATKKREITTKNTLIQPLMVRAVPNILR